MRKAAGRTVLIAVMLGGGLLYAGLSQAADIGAAEQQERAAELVAASGGPASPARLIPFEADKAAVEPRDDDVAPLDPASDDAEPAAPAASAAAAPTPDAAPRQLAAAVRGGHTP